MEGSHGGPKGDAYIEIHINPHPVFTRKDNDIHMELPVTLQEAILGGSVEVPTLTGRVALKIPAGSNSGKTMRLKSKGIEDKKNNTHGDQYIKLKVVLPDEPDESLKDFISEWAEKHTYDPRAKAGMNS